MSRERKGVKTEMNPAAWKIKSAWKQPKDSEQKREEAVRRRGNDP